MPFAAAESHADPQPGSLEARVDAMVLAQPQQDREMSPVNHTQGNRLQFVLTCGEHDSERVRLSNQRLFELLRSEAGPVALQVMPGQDHFQTPTSLQHAGHDWYATLHKMIQSNRPACVP